jgi:hypothetical protein
MKTIEKLKAPAWGLSHWQPDHAYAAFGCRMIDTANERMVILYDRKSLVFLPGLSEELQKLLLPQKQLDAALKLLKVAISPYRQTDQVYVIKDRINELWHTTTHASQNSSHGYVYLTIWVTPEEQLVPEGAVELKPKLNAGKTLPRKPKRKLK